MDLRIIDKPIPVMKTGGSFYARIPIYLQNRVMMLWNIDNIADCKITWSEDVKTREVHVHIAPKKGDA